MHFQTAYKDDTHFCYCAVLYFCVVYYFAGKVDLRKSYRRLSSIFQIIKHPCGKICRTLLRILFLFN